MIKSYHDLVKGYVLRRISIVFAKQVLTEKIRKYLLWNRFQNKIAGSFEKAKSVFLKRYKTVYRYCWMLYAGQAQIAFRGINPRSAPNGSLFQGIDWLIDVFWKECTSFAIDINNKGTSCDMTFLKPTRLFETSSNDGEVGRLRLRSFKPVFWVYITRLRLSQYASSVSIST